MWVRFFKRSACIDLYKMNIFTTLRHTGKPQKVLKDLEGNLKYSAQLTECRVWMEFHEDCVTNRTYIKHFWKSLRRNHVHITSTSLKRQTFNHIDTLKPYISKFKRTFSQRRVSLNLLNVTEQQNLEDFVLMVANSKHIT